MPSSDLPMQPPTRASDRRRRAWDVASDLNRGIRSGRYQPGDRLPTVLDLAE
jgi:DNA-binding FadR family transcriptional regulator